MDSTMIYAVKCGFSWIIVALSLAGYLVTLKRAHEKWPLWFVMAAGWTLLAVPNTLLAAGAFMDTGALTVLWLSSYVLVMASLLLLFLKLVEMLRRRKPGVATARPSDHLD